MEKIQIIWKTLANNPLYRLYNKFINSYRFVKYSTYFKYQTMSVKVLFLKAAKPLAVITGGVAVWYANKQWDSAAKALHIDVNNQKQMLEIFDSLDIDKSNTISREELGAGLAKAGMKISKSQLDAMMDIADENKSGDISRDEWIHALKHEHEKSQVGKATVAGAIAAQNKTTAIEKHNHFEPPKK